jgi:hypothetical protein
MVCSLVALSLVAEIDVEQGFLNDGPGPEAGPGQVGHELSECVYNHTLFNLHLGRWRTIWVTGERSISYLDLELKKLKNP